MKARENPLRVEKILQVRFQLEAIEAGLTLEKLVRRWENLGHRGAIIGPHGHGKTTLLEDLSAHFEKRGQKTLFLRFSREKRRFSRAQWQQVRNIAPQTILLLDGAEQLNCLDWARFRHFSHKSAGLIITSHRARLLPTLLECHTSSQLLGDILRQILGNEAALWDVECQALWQQHRGDLRLALREIYDFYAGQDATSESEAANC